MLLTGNFVVIDLTHFLCVLNFQGDPVLYLGAVNNPWRVEVSIKSGGGGLASFVGGNTSVTFVNGTG